MERYRGGWEGLRLKQEDWGVRRLLGSELRTSSLGPQAKDHHYCPPCLEDKTPDPISGTQSPLWRMGGIPLSPIHMPFSDSSALPCLTPQAFYTSSLSHTTLSLLALASSSPFVNTLSKPPRLWRAFQDAPSWSYTLSPARQ